MRWNRTCRVGALVLLFSLSVQLVVFSQNKAQQQPAGQPAADQTPAAQVAATVPVQAAQNTLLIMIDPAHGGSESGALLSPSLLEKDMTLAVARRLRQELGSRGLAAQLVRNTDATLSTDQRAAAVNAARPGLYISIHATSQGKGMRIYAALLPSRNEGGDRGLFRDWQTAQSVALSRSQSMQAQVFSSVQKTGFPIRALMAPLRPLNNVTVPALAIEIAPTTGNVSQLASADYQQMISAVLGNSIAAMGAKLTSEPAP
jgi:N-acetylmuramoyl-L-alanine amidase